jgi:hypothetical protein
MFELQCLALRKDAKMYKDRIEAILLQMEEVSIERDQVGATLVFRNGEPGVLGYWCGRHWSSSQSVLFCFVFFIYAQGNLAVLEDRTRDCLYKCIKVYLIQRRSLCGRRTQQSLWWGWGWGKEVGDFSRERKLLGA